QVGGVLPVAVESVAGLVQGHAALPIATVDVEVVVDGASVAHDQREGAPYAAAMFQDVVTSETELRQLYRPAPPTVESKILDRLEDHARTFIAASPFVLIGTTAADGTA